MRKTSLLIEGLRKTLPIVAERHELLVPSSHVGRRLIAMDIGTSKTGISLTDRARTTAMPWGLLHHNWDGNMDEMQFKRFASLLLQTSGIVAGYPLLLDGAEGTQCLKTLQILNNWQAKLGKPLPRLYLLDERMSTLCVEGEYGDALKFYHSDSLVSLTLLKAFLGFA
jgi:RNase H-fold protein (predicted Holliday junction resolvase)